ncbi:hypothetical protein NEOKW01_0587 [Nematocida sp. AWRm80]|nr:hypothetical protein NEOKW01_0587 [Nematocida sp. AWRm80]
MAEAINEYIHLEQYISDILPKELNKNSEIEIRLGSIIEKSTNRRLDIGALHPCVIDQGFGIRFQSSIEQRDYNGLVEYFTREIGVPETKVIVDTLLKGQRRSETKEINGKSVSVPAVLIVKRKLHSIDIHCPNSKYDVRIGISQEIQQEDIKAPGYNYGSRTKNRTTFSTDTYVIDATIVNTDTTNTQRNTLTYEVELEALNDKYNRNSFTQSVLEFIKTVKRVLEKK